jgi:hypothetical protein
VNEAGMRSETAGLDQQPSMDYSALRASPLAYAQGRPRRTFCGDKRRSAERQRCDRAGTPKNGLSVDGKAD